VADAVVIGAGPNGLVAANLLAARGWDVLVLEEQPVAGGAVKSSELIEPGFVNDHFSAFYPLAPASSIIRGLHLEDHGLRWRRSPAAVAHPEADGRCATIWLDLDRTAESLERFAPGDGERWRQVYRWWRRFGDALTDALFTPFPPIRAGARIAASLGPRDLLELLRFGVLPVRRYAEESFAGEGGAWLLAGNALHTDLTPDQPGGALFGLVLSGLGQQFGFPVPEGGSGRLTGALVRRLESHGGVIRTGAAVERVTVEHGRATGVRLAGGEAIRARRAVLADTGAPALFRDLVGEEHLPERLVDEIGRFQYDNSTVKIDWTLDGPIPWTAEEARCAGTIHVAEGMDALSEGSAQLTRRLIPSRPFLVMGQYACVDPSRQPEGRETAWAYTHVPQQVDGDAGGEGLTGRFDERETDLFVRRVEAEVERLAPGFRALIRGRHVFTPAKLEAANRNLVGGAVNNGTAQIHQQLVFRPVPGLGRPETAVRDLYLASSAAHPGGGVHGGPGGNAARAVLNAQRARRAAVGLGAVGAGALALRRAFPGSRRG
jgi:phytoene dehydrogenase-like protein